MQADVFYLSQSVSGGLPFATALKKTYSFLEKE